MPLISQTQLVPLLLEAEVLATRNLRHWPEVQKITKHFKEIHLLVRGFLTMEEKMMRLCKAVNIHLKNCHIGGRILVESGEESLPYDAICDQVQASMEEVGKHLEDILEDIRCRK
jgi:hypothetical protein